MQLLLENISDAAVQCKCIEADVRGTVTPLDSEQSGLMNDSELPIRVLQEKSLQCISLAEISQNTEQYVVANNYHGLTVNVDMMYVILGSGSQILSFSPRNIEVSIYHSTQEYDRWLRDNQGPISSRLLPCPAVETKLEPLAVPECYEYNDQHKRE